MTLTTCIEHPRRAAFLAALGLAACSTPSGPDGLPAGASEGGEALAVRVGALVDDGPTTIPYGGYVDFDGEPVNASGVKFNFAIFPCSTPGTGEGQCAPLWVAVGAWTPAADWTQGWPANAGLPLPIFSGRFTVELGGAGQTALPEALFEDEHGTLYLAIQIEGRGMGTLQKLAPAFKSIAAARSDRLRVRGELAFDDAAGGSALVSADDGIVIGHSDATQDRLLRVGAGPTPPLLVHGSGASVTGLTASSVMADDLEVRGALTGPEGHVEIDGVVAAFDVDGSMGAGLVYDSNTNLDGYLNGDGNAGYAMVDGRPVIRLSGGYLSIEEGARALMRPAPSQGWTAMMWFKPMTTLGNSTLMSNYACSVNFVNFGLDLQNKLSFGFRAGVDQGFGVSTPAPIEAGWHHVVGVRDETGTVRMYLDGELVGSQPANLNSHWDTNHGWYFGAVTPCGSGPANFFHGYLDAIRVYQRAVTADEIARYYAATKPLHP